MFIFWSKNNSPCWNLNDLLINNKIMNICRPFLQQYTVVCPHLWQIFDYYYQYQYFSISLQYINMTLPAPNDQPYISGIWKNQLCSIPCKYICFMSGILNEMHPFVQQMELFGWGFMGSVTLQFNQNAAAQHKHRSIPFQLSTVISLQCQCSPIASMC